MKDKIMKFLRKSYIQFIARFILGSVFIYASFHKIANPSEFAEIINNYKLFPEFSINIFAIILPWVELIAGLLLILGKYIKGSTAILSTLLIIFIIAISINIIRGLDFDCGCFSSSGKGSNPYSLLFRDILLLLPGIIIFLKIDKDESNNLRND